MGLGESVQKLFYLPEAHTDFLFAVLAEELGLAGVVLTLGAVPRHWSGAAFYIARLRLEAGLKFPAYLASGFGLWVGMQAFINIGVNMGVLPTKGLTLPLMSYGRSSLIVTLAWLGLLLRVYHEAKREQRGSAHLREGGDEPPDPHHGRRHRRACVPGAGAGAAAARAVPAGDLAGHRSAGSRRAWCRPSAFRSSGCRWADCAARAC